MPQVTSKEQFWYKLERLDTVEQETVLAFIDSLLEAHAAAERRDKRRLLGLSVWTEQDIQQIEDAQDRINQWQLPAF